jgi:2-dehydropantoate 2-reductase
MKSNIYIIGAGAVGKALAVFLTLTGRDVCLVRGSVDNEASRAEEITVILNDEQELRAEIEVATLSSFERLDGMVVLTNKSFGNPHLAGALKGRTDSSPVVLLQNGLGVEQPFIEAEFSEIYRCVLFLASQINPAGEVSFKPVAVCPVGVINGRHDTLEQIVDALDTPNLRFHAEREIQTVIWTKAIINSVFNSICPLLDVDNGVFHRDAKVLEIAKRVIAECIEIAADKGTALEMDEVVERLLLISRSSDGQLISTLQDIQNKRQTEIETLNLAIVEIARTLNKADRVKETQLLGELTKIKSDISRR